MPRSLYNLSSIAILLCFGVALLSYGCARPTQHELRIATAASVQYAVSDIIEAFYKETGISVEMVTGSSGKLSVQITQGAPIDIFISADMQYPMSLYQSGYTSAKPALYAYGKLVIWTTQNIEPSLENMLSQEVNHIAIPNPKTAPYGVLAMAVLKNARILEKVKDKLVYATNVGQACQFIDSGAAEIGITAKSMVVSDHLKDKGSWAEISETLYAPIEQGICLINKEDAMEDAAKVFYTYMFNEVSRTILARHGFSLPSS